MKLLITTALLMLAAPTFAANPELPKMNPKGLAWLQAQTELKELENDPPMKISEHLVRESFRFTGDTMIVTWVFQGEEQVMLDALKSNGISKAEFVKEGEARTIADICSEPSNRKIIANDAKVSYVFRFSDGPVAYVAVVDRC